MTVISTTRMVLVVLLGWSTMAVADESAPGNDHSRTRLMGMEGEITWEPLLHEEGLEGWETSGDPWTPDAWSREGHTVISQTTTGSKTRLLQGDSGWKNYELKVQGTLVKGSNLQIPFRISEDGQAFYFLDCLMGWQAVSISKRDPTTGVTKLDVANFSIEYGREYDIVIAVRGHSIRSYIDGQLVNVLSDDTHIRGAVGLATWGRNTMARFRDPMIRHYH